MNLLYTKKKSDYYFTVRDVLRQEFHLSHQLMLKLKKSKQIYVNSKFVYLDQILNSGDMITVNLDFEEDSNNIIPKQLKLSILWEDEALLIIDKSAGIPIHPSIEHYTDSLSNGVKYYYEEKGIHRKIRPINRLDRNTSGICIFAKNEYIQECLASQMRSEQFKKQYIAICHGYFDQKSGIIDAPIARKKNSIIERCVCENGQQAITHYTVLHEKNQLSKVLVTLKTGRTHQIRVHMAHIGHPILGDDLYGLQSTNLISRQALHAYQISFFHPISHQKLELISPLPKDMENIDI